MSARHEENPRAASTTTIEPPVDVDILKEEAQEVHHEAVPKPESIRNMTDAELTALRNKMVRKMDMVIMPIMGILYLLNCELPLKSRDTPSLCGTPVADLCIDVDRSALAATKLYGIMEDLNMDTTDFATAISILFGTAIPRRRRS